MQKIFISDVKCIKKLIEKLVQDAILRIQIVLDSNKNWLILVVDTSVTFREPTISKQKEKIYFFVDWYLQFKVLTKLKNMQHRIYLLFINAQFQVSALRQRTSIDLFRSSSPYIS